MRTAVPTGLLLAAAIAAPAAAAADVELRVIAAGEVAPGVYGRLELGTAPPPPVLYAKPLVIVKPVGAPPPAIYLHVPPGHAKKWSKHCQRYGACDRPVYFVKSAEYEPGYKPKKEKKDK